MASTNERLDDLPEEENHNSITTSSEYEGFSCEQRIVTDIFNFVHIERTGHARRNNATTQQRLLARL
jgi:hypothetical protein